MTSQSHPDPEQLAAYARAKLPESAAEAVADHLEGCPACDTTVTSLEKEGDTVVSALRQAPIPEAFSDEPECREAVERIRVMEPQAATVTQVLPEGPEPEATVRTPAPRQLREYRLLEKLGQGGMGTVYKALHTKLDKLVALKVLPAAAMSDAELVARFEREMKAVGKLEHPNIVRAMDAGCHEGTHFLVMEYVDGLDLSEVVKRCGGLRIADACEVIRQAAVGLRHADEHALVHRDIKPSNLVLNADGEIKILDLGLALLQADPRPGEEATGRGRAMGTIDYIAPEQVRDSHRVDIRADLYSLGCTLYKLLTGQSPFSGPRYENTFDKMMAHLNDPVPPVRQLRPDVPEKLAAVLDRMVAKDRDARYAKPGLVADEVKPFCPGCDLAGLLMQARKEAKADTLGQEKLPSPSGRGTGGEGVGPGKPLAGGRPSPPALGAGLPTPPKPATARSPESAAHPPEPRGPGRPIGREEGGVRRPAPSAQSPAPSAQSPASQSSRPTPNPQLPTPFDPYHKWLGIPPAEQPPNHYRLLGIPLFEEDRDVIQAAAERQTVFLRNVALGKHSKESQRLLNEVHQAKLRLLTPEEKAAYDAGLRKELAAKAAAAPGKGEKPGKPSPAEDEGAVFARVLGDMVASAPARLQPSAAKARAAARVRAYLPRVPRLAWVASACAAAVVLLGVIYVTTNKGTVKIELSDPTAKVEVKVDGDEIEIAGLKDPLRLSVGEHALEVTSGDFKTVTERFVITRGSETPVRITLVPKTRPGAPDEFPFPRGEAGGAASPRWLGYELGLTKSAEVLPEAASYTNLSLVHRWRAAGPKDAVFGAARTQGMKVVLGVGPGIQTQEFLDRGPSLWAANRDVVIGAVLERPGQGFDLADWCKKFKQAMPEAQLWLIPGRGDSETPIPNEVDMVVLSLDKVESPAQVQMFCEKELTAHLKRFEGPRTMVAWNDPVGQEPPGSVPTCKTGTFRAVAKMVQDHHLAGVLFATYGPWLDFVGIQTRPELVAEIKEIAKEWRIGSDAAAGSSGSGDAKGPHPGPLPKEERTEPTAARPQGADRWLGYGAGKGAVAEVGGYTNIVWGRDDETCQAAKVAGLKVVLPFEGKDDAIEAVQNGVLETASRHRDVVTAVCWEMPDVRGGPAKVSAFGRRLKETVPGVQLWCNLPWWSEEARNFPLPKEADALVVEIGYVTTPQEVKTTADRGLVERVAKAAGRPVILVWWHGHKESPLGLVPLCRPGTMRALGEVVERNLLKGLILVGYETTPQGTVGIGTSPMLVSEVKEIAEKWGVSRP